MDVLKFAEGEPVPPPFQVSIPLDGVRFELLGDEGTPFIVIYLPDMTNEEAQKIRLSPIESAYIAESYFWLGLINFDGMIFELQFSPMEYFVRYGHFSADFFVKNRLARVLGVDSASGEIIVLRCVTFSSKFCKSARFSFDNFEPMVGYDLVYNGDFLKKWRQFNIEQLWNKAQKTGTFHDNWL